MNLPSCRHRTDNPNRRGFHGHTQGALTRQTKGVWKGHCRFCQCPSSVRVNLMGACGPTVGGCERPLAGQDAASSPCDVSALGGTRSGRPALEIHGLEQLGDRCCSLEAQCGERQDLAVRSIGAEEFQSRRARIAGGQRGTTSRGQDRGGSRRRGVSWTILRWRRAGHPRSGAIDTRAILGKSRKDPLSERILIVGECPSSGL
jgi:hypothetical protein